MIKLSIFYSKIEIQDLMYTTEAEKLIADNSLFSLPHFLKTPL